MDNVESGDEDVRKNLGAIPSAKAVNPHQQQQQCGLCSRNCERQRCVRRNFLHMFFLKKNLYIIVALKKFLLVDCHSGWYE